MFYLHSVKEYLMVTQKYPLPTRKATDNRIGKGGNRFVFSLIHERREYAVKR